MSDLKVEATEPDPAATSLPNDEVVVKRESADPSAPTAVEVVADKVEPVKKEENGAAPEVKSEHTEMTKETKEDNKSKPRTYENGVLKTSAQVIEGKNNSRYDASILPESEDPSKIRAQVEFYFGDSNLPTDKYMWSLTDGAENKPVDLSDILNFGRMKRFKSREIIVAALKESKSLEVTGEEGQEKISRKVPYDPTFTKAAKIEARCIYVKGFGDEEPSSQFDIEAFFSPYGPTNAVRLRRTDDKLFKGSVFVEFQDEETAKKFLELEPKPLWKGKHVLLIQSKKDYVGGKTQDIKDGKLDPKEARSPFHRGRGRGRGRGGRGGNFKGGDRDRDGGRDRGDRDPDDWKKRREDDRASGFKDERRNGRGGRGDHKKGGRGGRRDDRGSRSNDRNREREDKAQDKEVKAEVEAKTEIKNEEPNEKKRPREDDGTDEKPAKKVDTKSEVTVES